MQARALKNLMQLPEAERLDAIAEGLRLLVEHVSTLTDDMVFLADNARPRGMLMIEAQSQEEAAKVLILLDLVRLGWRDHTKVKEQLRRFYDHLARCIYADLSRMRPAHFSEVRGIINDMRQAYYLDGPNDVDWIFRNEALSAREEGLYVDYVRYEHGSEWVTPAQRSSYITNPRTGAQQLVIALHRLGVTSRHGLDIVANTWVGQAIEDDAHWSTIRDLNRKVVTTLIQDSAALPDATPADAHLVIEQWTYPIHSLDLREIDVKIKDLQDIRERHFAAQSW